MATVKENAAKIERLQSDVKDVAQAAHDLTKLLMQDKTAPALTAHRGKWKKVLQKLETIATTLSTDSSTQQEEVDA